MLKSFSEVAPVLQNDVAVSDSQLIANADITDR